MRKTEWKKKILLSLPYFVIALLCTNLGECWRLASGSNIVKKLQGIVWGGLIGKAFSNGLVSFHLSDMLVGLFFAVFFRICTVKLLSFV